MSARRVRRPRSVTISIDDLAGHDPAFAAMDAVLLGMGYDRAKVSVLRRRRSGRISGRIVWRRDGCSIVWASTFGHG